MPMISILDLFTNNVVPFIMPLNKFEGFFMRICRICKQKKQIVEFFKNRRAKDGLSSECRQCESKRKKKYAEKNLDHIRKQKKENMAKLRLKKKKYRIIEYIEPGKKKCTKCKKIQFLEQFGKNKKGKNGIHYWCRSCISDYAKELKTKNPERWKRQLEKNFIKQRLLRGLDPNEPPRKAWPGSGYLNKDGYMTFKKKGHPCADKNGRCQEHHLVMYEYLGRPLKKGESIHHINGIRNDNRLENLELWSCKHPPGQRVEDKIKWCIEFLSEYGYKVEKIEVLT